MVRDAKYNFEHKLAHDIKSDPRAFFAYARSRTSLKEEVLAVTKEDGSLTTSLEETSDIMNQKFQEVFTNTEGITPPAVTHVTEAKLEICDIDLDEVAAVKGLKTPSAPGPDGVHPIMLKECALSLSKPLLYIFKKSMKSGDLPRDWKQANVTPIFKKGKRSDPLNYRPVSLTSVACKTLEKLIRKRVVEHLETNNLLSKYQHGFRSKMSCLTQLLEYFFDLENALDDGESVDALYMDCRKAFDTVPHEHLIVKLQGMDIDGQVGKWITGFLRGREQRVAVKGCYSGWRAVRSGVPQGSVLGPTLFLIFIDDLLKNLDSPGKLFADDAKIYRRIGGPRDGVILQEDIYKLEIWSQKWLLDSNKDKCKVMHFGPKNPGYSYSLRGTTLMVTDKEKDLGVIVTPDLKASEQVSRAAAAANSMLGRIRKTFTCMDKEMFLPLYKTLVRPRMEHAIQAWSPYLQKDINKLEKVQRRATKLIPELADKPYEVCLAELNMTTLEDRRHRGDMIEAFKLIHGFDIVNAGEDFLKLETGSHRDRTRGHALKLQKPRHRTLKRNMFFSSRIIEQWNKLPEDVVTSQSVNIFKNRYDKHIDKTMERGSIL